MTSKAPASKPPATPAMLVDTDHLFRLAKDGASTFLQARPFSHLHITPFLKPVCCQAVYEGMQEWPAPAPGNFYPQGELPSVMRLLLWELSSSTVIRHIATLTDKPPLLPDPFLLRSGVSAFTGGECVHVAEQEYFQRHPETQLLNVLRLELFVSKNPAATFWLELIDTDGKIATSHIASSGSALLLNSDRYHVHYHCVQNTKWHSLVAYYFINDRARNLNGQEQPRVTN